MKQPSIKVFGGVYKVSEIGFGESGKVEKIVYLVGDQNHSIYKNEEMISSNLKSTYKIQKPTVHPYHSYSFAPNLENLLIF